MDTNEGNKIIAEFMGCYGGIHYCGNEEVYAYGFKDTHITERWREPLFNDRTPYHESWDWLMPVVEKINNTTIGDEKFDVIIYQTSCHINDTEQILIEKNYYKSLIQCVYDAVTEFIQWYNTQNKQLNIE